MGYDQQRSADEGSTGHGIGVGDVHEINCTKSMDKSTPTLMQYCVTGKHIATAKITGVLVSGDSRITFYENDLEKAYITNYHCGAGANGRPDETFAIDFVTHHVKYIQQDNDGNPLGTTEHKWDQQKSASK